MTCACLICLNDVIHFYEKPTRTQETFKITISNLINQMLQSIILVLNYSFVFLWDIWWVWKTCYVSDSNA